MTASLVAKASADAFANLSERLGLSAGGFFFWTDCPFSTLRKFNLRERRL